MRTKRAAWILGLFLSAAANAQQATHLPNSKVANALDRMQSADLQTRETAFDELMRDLSSEVQNQTNPDEPSEVLPMFFKQHPDQAERVKLGLIQLLGKESETFMGKSVPPGTYSEGDMEHYAQLIEAVSELNDGRALPALIGAMTTGGIAAGGILRFGDKALGPLLEQLKNPDGPVRARALEIAVTILKAADNDASPTRIRDLLRSSLKDTDASVRTAAVTLIECRDDRRDFVAVLQDLAKNDPERFPGKTDDGVDGDWHYPVRVQARRVPRDIENNKTCKP
jgi:hypothetical protein